MKNLNRGFVNSLLLIILIIVVVSGVYLYSKKETYVNPVTDNTAVVSASTSTNSNVNHIGLADEAFIKATSNPDAKVIAKGDINKDGYEDAILQEINCGASCSISLDVVLNINNTSAVLAVSDAFEPAYYSSSAAKSELIKILIENGVISLTGYGLDCGGDRTTDSDICTKEKWDVLHTIKFKLNSANSASKYYLERI
jgi:hypothetical protein